MSSASFNLRNLTPDMMASLKRKAAQKKVSVNTLLLQIISQDLGISKPTKKTIYHDLDHLAGTWNDEDKKEFEENTVFFEKIDEDLWL